jgi:hypothetical protein
MSRNIEYNGRKKVRRKTKEKNGGRKGGVEFGSKS